MSDVKIDTHFSSMLWIMLIVLGGAIIVLGFIIDWLGFGRPGSFGSGQFLLVLFGFSLLLIGLLRKRILNFYRGLAIILLNTLLLLGILELVAIVISRSYMQAGYNKILQLPYYANQDWAELYWREAKLAENYTYMPYVIWKRHSFAGKTVNIDQDGIRQTPGSDCSGDAYKLFAFGGSTMLGWGSPDWETIPAHLQKGLKDRVKKALCVHNLAEDGYVSTQAIISFILQLQSGNIPDAVVFYDGVNDVIAAYESGLPTVHPLLAKITAKFEERENQLVKWFKSSRVYHLVNKLIRKNADIKSENSLYFIHMKNVNIHTDNLAERVTEVYLNNYRIVEALAKQFGFSFYFFWQPLLGTGNKRLTAEEQEIRTKMEPAFSELANSIYRNIALKEKEYENLFYLANIFDTTHKLIWIDEWGHVTPEGNRIIAERMLEVLGN